GTNKVITIAGNTISGTDAANYTLTQPTTTASITAKELTISGITASNRVYDATIFATALLNKSSATLVGIQSNDDIALSTSSLIATFANKNAGINKTVTVSGASISGTDVGNYTLTQPTTTASITAKSLTISGITADDREYDATASATALLNKSSAAIVGKESGDVVTLSTSGATASFATKTIGTNKVITITGNTISGADAANYTLTQPTTTASITAKELTITGITAGDRVYDATTSATALLDTSAAALSGIAGSDTVTLSTSGATASFATKTIGTNKVITIAGNTISGTDAGNYTLTQPTTTASITAKELTISGITTLNRAYDGTTSATSLINSNGATVVGKQGSDSVSANYASLSAVFANANVGANKAITISGIVLTGTDSTNYTLTQPTTTATITQASAGLSWSNPADITFGDSLNNTELNAAASVPGTYAYTPSSGTRLNAGTHTLSVTFTPTSGNYAVATTTVSLTVNTKPVTVTAVNETVTYGTSVNSQITVSGLASGDVADSATYTYAGTNSTSYPSSTTAPVTAGTYAVSPSVLILTSGSTSNYSITYAAGTLTINKAAQVALVVIPARTTVTYSPAPNKTTVSLSTSGGSGDGAVTYAVANGDPCTITGSTLTVDGAGSCAVTATKATGTNHLARTSAAVTLAVDKAAQTLSLNSIGAKAYGDNDFAVTTSATSALTVALTASPTSVCTVSGLIVHIASNGNCTITASQSGDANWLAATAAPSSSDTRSFVINAKTLTVTGASTIGRAYNGSTTATSLLNFTSSALSGVVQGDTVILDTTNAVGTFASKVVGTSKAVTVTGLALTGTHASRYTLAMPTGLSADITALPITVLGITVPTRAYNLSNIATLATSSYSFTDVVNGDAVTLDDSNYTATFSNANVSPTAKTVTVSGLALSGNDAQNYVLAQPVLQGTIIKATGSVQFAASRTTTYDGSAKALATSTTPSSLSLVHEYNGTGATAYGPLATAPTNAGTYSLLATINDINYQGAGNSAWTINKQVVNVLLTGNATTFNGTARALSAATSPAGKNLVVTYSGTNGNSYHSTFAPVNAGTYTVTAAVEEGNFAGSESVTLEIAQAPQSALAFVDSNAVEFGTTHQLVALGGSGSGALTYSTISGSCNVNAATGLLAPTAAGSCVVRATREASTNFTAVSSSQRLVTIAKGTQTVAFTSFVPSNPVKDSTYTPTATSTSGLSVSLAITSGSGAVCSMASGVVTFLASGVCTITASQAGNSNFLDATPVTQTIEVGKLNQTITFEQPPSLRVGDPSIDLGASSSSGLAVQYAVAAGGTVCSVTTLGIVAALTSGTCTITATQSGDAVFGAASAVSRTLTVAANFASAPHISSISAGDSTLTVGYVAPSSNGGSPILSYSVVARSTTAPTITKSDCGTAPLSCTLVGLINSASYTVSVSANNLAGTGPSSENAEVLIPAPSLEAVRGVSGSRDSTTMDVAWEDPASFGDGSFVRYEIAIRERNGIFDAPVTVQSVGSSHVNIRSFVPTSNWSGNDGVVRATTTQARTVRFLNLNPAVTYETRIVTITTTRSAQTSTNTANALMMPLRVPSTPRVLNIDVPDGRTAKVSWVAPLADGGSALTGYAITTSAGTCTQASAL
ncbi:MAG: YDG domain-containing protein, partial [Actinomycetes bacterium]